MFAESFPVAKLLILGAEPHCLTDGLDGVLDQGQVSPDSAAVAGSRS